MKKFFTITLILIITFWLLLKVFDVFNSKNVLSNQAAFEIYLNLNTNEIDNFFNLPSGTFDSQKHRIICKLPVNTSGFKPAYIVVKQYKNINCDENFDAKKIAKYDNSELNTNDNYLQLMIVKSSTPLITFDESLMRDNIISSKVEEYKYSLGKVNYVVISKDSIYDFCK